MLDNRTLENCDSARADQARLKWAEREQFVEHLFRQHYSEMIHLARTLLYDDGEAEDTVQDVFVRLMESDIVPSAERTRAYLMIAVRNGCMNRISRKQIWEQVRNLYPIDTEADLQPIDKRLGRLDEILAFVDGQMEEPHRSIFHLRFDEDLTLSEIARRLDLNINTAYKYLTQCIQRIRFHFTER